MNKQENKQQDNLNIIYQYFCATIQQNKTIYIPKNIMKVEQCFQELLTHINCNEKTIPDKSNVDGYIQKKCVKEGEKWLNE